MMRPSIIFDLDGTLIDSAPDVCRSLNKVLESLDRRPHSVDEVKSYLGQGARILMENALLTTGSVPDGACIDELTSAFLADYAKYPVVDSAIFPGVFNALDILIERGAILAICTNKPLITCNPVLEALKLDSYFKAVVCPDHVQYKKPDGRHILDTIDIIGGSVDSAIMVGDSENDIFAAIDANIPSIAVTFGYSGLPHDELGANALIDSFDQLIASIDDVLASCKKLPV